MVDRPISEAITVTGGACVMLLGTFLPWLRSGTRNRSSYTIFDLVERLGFAPGGVVAWSLRLWPLVPLALVAMTVAVWAVVTDHVRWRLAAAAISVSVVWVAGTAAALFFAPGIGLFRVGAGPTVTLAGAAVVAVGGVMLRRPESAASAVA